MDPLAALSLAVALNTVVFLVDGLLTVYIQVHMLFIAICKLCLSLLWLHKNSPPVLEQCYFQQVPDQNISGFVSAVNLSIFF